VPSRVPAAATLLAALAVLAALPVRARAEDLSAAEVLFREARELLTRGSYAAACQKLEQSQRLEPAPGTEFNLARCYELMGLFASAWGAYVDVASVTHASGQFEREARARERVAAVEPRLSFVTVSMRAPSDRAHLTRDGIEMAPAQLEVAIPVDPGEHVLHASAPGKRDWEARFRIDRDAQRVAVEIPPLEDLPPAEAPPPAALPAPVVVAAPPSEARNAPPSPRGQHIAAASILGAGLITLGVGAYFGIEKVTLASRAWNECPQQPCSQTAQATISQSNTAGDWATGWFIGAGVLTGAAGIVWFTAPKPAASPARAPRSAFVVSPTMSPSSAGLSLRGEFE
jgi:hypothetical protein